MERLMLRAIFQLKTVVQQNRIEPKLQNRNVLKQKSGFSLMLLLLLLLLMKEVALENTNCNRLFILTNV